MKLLIDTGNTRTKWAWCPEHPITAATQLSVDSLENVLWLEGESHSDVQALHAAIQQADEIWLSNVAGDAFMQQLEKLQPKQVFLIKATVAVLELHNHYTDPAQLGSDRWCSLLAVWQLYGASALVVTAGTALTIDALMVEQSNKTAAFVGGSIQPGLRLMWQSLQQGAAQLDYIYPDSDLPPDGFALNSQQAMWSGCVHALAAPVAARYATLVSKMPGQSPVLVLSGGDASSLQRYLPESLSTQTIIVDNLVLKGLACLAESTQQ